MPRKNLNLDGKIGARKCKVRKRVCSSSSSSSLYQNCRLKRVFLVGKKTGSSTPVPKWKTMDSKSPSSENDGSLRHLAAVKGCQRAKDLSVSARKLAASLWEIDGLPSARFKGQSLDEDVHEVGVLQKETNFERPNLGSRALVLTDLSHSLDSEVMDLPETGSHRRRESAGSQKTMHTNSNLVEVDSVHKPARSWSRNRTGHNNLLRDVYNGLVTSKELLKVMARISCLGQHNSTGLSLFSALKFELDRACTHVTKLFQEQKQNQTDIDTLFKHFEEEKTRWRLRQRDKIQMAVSSIAGELEKEKKLRIQTERLNKKLGKDLSEMKDLLLKANKEIEGEKRARGILEQVCDELARAVGEDRAEVEELKRQSAKVCEEVEKEREMLQMADILREERVQMKLSEARYHFEEKNAIVDKLRHELESCLRSRKGEEGENGSHSYDKINELEKYLQETLPCTKNYGEKDENFIEVVNKVEEEEQEEEEQEEEEEEDDEGDRGSGDSDLHSIELNMDDATKNFKWGDGTRNERSRKTKKPVIEWEFSSTRSKGENFDALEKRGLFEFAPRPWKEVEDEIERYNMIKDLRDHIVSGSKMTSSQDSVSQNRNELGQERAVCGKEQNGVVCQG